MKKSTRIVERKKIARKMFDAVSKLCIETFGRNFEFDNIRETGYERMDWIPCGGNWWSSHHAALQISRAEVRYSIWDVPFGTDYKRIWKPGMDFDEGFSAFRDDIEKTGEIWDWKGKKKR